MGQHAASSCSAPRMSTSSPFFWLLGEVMTPPSPSAAKDTAAAGRQHCSQQQELPQDSSAWDFSRTGGAHPTSAHPMDRAGGEVATWDLGGWVYVFLVSLIWGSKAVYSWCCALAVFKPMVLANRENCHSFHLFCNLVWSVLAWLGFALPSSEEPLSSQMFR